VSVKLLKFWYILAFHLDILIWNKQAIHLRCVDILTCLIII